MLFTGDIVEAVGRFHLLVRRVVHHRRGEDVEAEEGDDVLLLRRGVWFLWKEGR